MISLPLLVQAEEYVLPGSWPIYDANGKAIADSDNVTVDLNFQWQGSWAVFKSTQPIKKLDQQLFKEVSLVTKDKNGIKLIKKAYIPMHAFDDSKVPVAAGSTIPNKSKTKIQAVETKRMDVNMGTEAANGAICLSCTEGQLAKAAKDIHEAQTKKFEAKVKRRISLEGYKSIKQPNHGGWGRCANMIKKDGTLGAWGKIAVQSMLKNEEDYRQSNPAMRTICPNFEKFEEEEKFDYYLWVTMALMAEESGCDPTEESPVYANDGSCFNPSCTSAHGLCQLPQGWGNMKDAGANTRACVKTIHETNVNPGKKVQAYIGVSPRFYGSGENHFGPFNFEAHLWRTYKPKLHHFLSQWHDKCGKFPSSRQVYFKILEENKKKEKEKKK